MVKLVITLLNVLVILVLQIFPDDVSVKLDVPAQVQAGSEFEVKVTLNKGDLDGFSRFQQNIPAGLTASPVVSSNADFSFSEKRVRFIWLRIPENHEITFSYKVRIDERLKGTFNLGGKFSYIENNERKSVDISPVSVNITPSEKIDPSLVVDINDFERTFMPQGSVPASAISIACIRQTPVQGNQGDYVVNVLVSKNLTRQFAKIEETVPAGYTAVALDPKDAIFTFKEQKVKFLWMNLPQQPYFTVSYRLIPRNQAKLQAPVIDGDFSYLVDEKTVSVDIIQSDVNLAEIKPENVDQIIASAIANPSMNLAHTETPDNKPIEVAGNNTNSAVTIADQKQSQRFTEARTGNTKSNPVRQTSNENKSSLTTVDGVYFRIQLAAGHKPVNVNRYFSSLRLDKKILIENHNGWRKYSVGSFGKYKEARDYRVHIQNTTPVKDAFITAYNSGQRITVQEALMITEQKWVQ